MSTRTKKTQAGSGVRIIAGEWRGRRFKLPPGTQARPTPDRVRETLFNWIGPAIAGARCLDLYAGSGILGLEALSRGAAAVDFVESDRKLAAALGQRLAELDCDAAVRAERVERFLAQGAAAVYDIVFVDPPYALPLEPVLALLWPLTHAGTLVYLERPVKQGLPIVAGLQWRKQSRAGAVCYGLAERGAAA